MKLKNKIIKGSVLGVSLLLLSDTAHGISKAPSAPSEEPLQISDFRKSGLSSEKNSASASSIHIGPTATGIRIYVNNGLLVDVLQQVANYTDIQFRLANALNSKRINVNIQARDWESGVERLLKDFSKVTVWDKHARMDNILLLGMNHWEPEEALQTNTHSHSSEVPQKAQGKPGLPISKLKQLVQVKPGQSIPPDLFADEEVQRYLKLKGIRSSSDWKQIKKGRVVHHLAKRELVRLLYEQQRKTRVN
ncbi:MAG: hypothetical protein NPINA01_14700 [Nitrospinaceae bacterium]|nr:MAG: hypothetical protein NPINA01_14700 [Nitrospinaceae bacterium]